MATGARGVLRPQSIRELSLFGSVLTEQFREDSDIDMLAEFEPGHVPGCFGLVGTEGALRGSGGGVRSSSV